MTAPPLLEVRGLCKRFPVRSTGLWPRTIGAVNAVDQVSFQLRRGGTLGLVGESGCGKSTTARCILRAHRPTAGSVILRDGDRPPVDLAALSERDLLPLRRRMQMVFQDPFASLNPRMTVARIVGEPLLVHGVGTRRERDDRVAEALRLVGLDPGQAQRYPHEFSGGQRQRIAIARALILEPALVVFDEAVSALDVSVQAQIVNLIADLRQRLGLTSIFVSHDLGVVRWLCDEVAVMYAGRIVEQAPTAQLFADPRHPYTRALLAAVPDPDPRRVLDAPLLGEVPNPASLPPGCAFHPRCSLCIDRCRSELPQPIDLGGRTAACHLAG